jgi:hypothetical protein
MTLAQQNNHCDRIQHLFEVSTLRPVSVAQYALQRRSAASSRRRIRSE